MATRPVRRVQRQYTYRDHGNAVSCTLCVRTPTGRLLPVRRATVSKTAIARLLQRRQPELGWSFKKFVRKAARAAKHLARGVVDKVIKPVGKAWVKVEQAVRPIGKKIPVVGYFARLHEKYVAPYTQALFKAKKHAKRIALKGTPAQKAAALATLKRAAVAHTRAQAYALKATAVIARTPTRTLAKRTRAFRKRANLYVVRTPNGRVFRIPAAALSA